MAELPKDEFIRYARPFISGGGKVKKITLRKLGFHFVQLLIFIGSFFFISSCGGGGGGGGDGGPAHAPIISNLSVSPQSATLNQDGGEVAVTMTYQFSDAGSDVSTFTVNIYDSVSGTLLDSQTNSSAASGHTSGTLTLSGGSFPTITAMTYKIEIFLTDAMGAQSNKLEGTFVVQ